MAAAILSSLSWPHFSFLFAILFVILFRSQLGHLLSRVTSIDKSGIKAEPSPEIQREEKKKEAAQELLDAIGNSVVLSEIEGRIRQDLQTRGLDAEGPTVKVLIKHLAATRVLLQFEQVHNLIFGSQIFMLKKLNEVAGQGKPREFIVTYFEHVKQRHSDFYGNSTFEQYIGFLQARSLVLERDGMFHITNLGVEFLTWMVRNGRSEDKAY